jgi:hypothetical protein
MNKTEADSISKYFVTECRINQVTGNQHKVTVSTLRTNCLVVQLMSSSV